MPSLSVSLSPEEYSEVAKQAKREKMTPNAYVAALVRTSLKEQP